MPHNIKPNLPEHGPQPFSKYDWEEPSPLYRVLPDRVEFGTEDPKWRWIWRFKDPEPKWIGQNTKAHHELGWLDHDGNIHGPSPVKP